MIKVTVLYPTTKGARFDKAYYLAKHIPLAVRKLGAALKAYDVEMGLAGATPGSEPPYVAIANFNFDSVEAFQGAFGPHADEIMGDVPKYTSIPLVIQISSIELSA